MATQNSDARCYQEPERPVDDQHVGSFVVNGHRVWPRTTTAAFRPETA